MSRNKTCALNWTTLLSPKRVCIQDVDPRRVCCRPLQTNDMRSPFERDYCHVIYSGAFRRMANKTQVAAFPQVDYVRFRLTHSLEVSTIAGSLLRESLKLMRKHRGIDLDRYSDADWVVRTAGLVHDIGNPPYGHAGERAIQDWAKKRFPKKSNVFVKGLKCFDGNAESFRVLSRPDLQGSLYHRMTCAVLGTIVKYPYLVDSAKCGHPKFSAFGIDAQVFDAVMRELGLCRDDGKYIRHPLSFLLEAADDICYLLSDFEDAVRLDILSEVIVCEKLLDLYPELKSGKIKDLRLSKLRSKIAELLIRDYSRAFDSAYEQLMSGCVTDGEAFAKYLPQELKDRLRCIRNFERTIFQNSKIVSKEQLGAKELIGALNYYAKAIKRVKKVKDIKSDELISTLCDEKIDCGCLDMSEEWWTHAIIDYVVGMTDGYIHQMFGKKGS